MTTSQHPHIIANNIISTQADCEENVMALFVVWGYQWTGHFGWAGPEGAVTNARARNELTGLRLAREG